MLKIMRPKIILDLCGGTGEWSRPYEEAGYDVRIWTLPNDDIRLKEFDPLLDVHGILAAPPCTHLAGLGAKYWKLKGRGALILAMETVDACLRMVLNYAPIWWALENPVGRLTSMLGPPKLWFHPWEYGDFYTKKTGLWGDFTVPPKTPYTGPISKEWVHNQPRGEDQAARRSVTSRYFAEAFFKANP